MITVTGATGHIGGAVARTLAAEGEQLRLVVRDPSRALVLPGAEVVQAAFGDDAMSRALEGAGTLFMVSAGEHPDRVRQHLSVIDAAVQAGVQHLVYLSFFGAGPEATFTLARDHWATEEWIRGSGLPFTILRDNLYADSLAAMVGADDVLRGPAGSGRAAVVAQRDVADCVVAVLREPEAHADRRYELTGPEAMGLAEVAETLSRHTGRQVSYHDETEDEAYASRAGYGAPDWMVTGWVSAYMAIAAGELARVTDDVARLSGHAATSYDELLSR